MAACLERLRTIGSRSRTFTGELDQRDPKPARIIASKLYGLSRVISKLERQAQS
jgi:hypothetical protein